MAIDRIINLRVDAGDTSAIIDKLKKKTEELKNELQDVKKEGNEPIQLDVNTDSSKIKDLISSLDDADKAKQVLGIDPVEVTITDNIDEEKEKITELGATLDATDLDKEITLAIDASKAVASLDEARNSQKQLTDLMLRAGEGTDGYIRLAQAAGEVKDRVNDARESVISFSQSNIENVSSGFQKVKASLIDLNFVEFNNQVKLLGENSKKVTFKELASSVGETGKSFASLGKIIASNPIGLLATVIGLVIANFDSLKETFKNFLPGFDTLKKLVDGVIGAFNAFTDAIGLTNNALNASTEAAINASQQRLEAIKTNSEKEIAIQRALGKDTYVIQQQAADNQRKEINKQIEALKDLQSAGAILSDAQKKHLEELKKQYADLSTQMDVAAAGAIKSAQDVGAELKAIIESSDQSIASSADKKIAGLQEKVKTSSTKAKDAVKKATEEYGELLKAVRERKGTSKDDVVLVEFHGDITDVEDKRKELLDIIKTGQDQIRSNEVDLAAATSQIRNKQRKDEAELARQRRDDAKKYIAEQLAATTAQAKQVELVQAATKLREQRNMIDVENVDLARLQLRLGNELLKIDEELLAQDLRAGKISIDEYNKKIQKIREQYALETSLSNELIEQFKKIGAIDVEFDIKTQQAQDELDTIDKKLRSIRDRQIVLELQVRDTGVTDEIIAERKLLNIQVQQLEDEADRKILQMNYTTLEAQTEKLRVERAAQIKLLEDSADEYGRALTPETRQIAVTKVANIDKTLEDNQKLLDFYKSLNEAIAQTGVEINDAAKTVIANEVQRLEGLRAIGVEISKTEKEFLSANKNIHLEIEIDFDKQQVDEARAQLEKLKNLLANAPLNLPAPDRELLKQQIDEAAKDYLDRVKKLQSDVEDLRKQNGGLWEKIAGVSDQDVSAIKSAQQDLINQVWQTAYDLVAIQAEAEQAANQRRLDKRLDFLDQLHNIELDAIDRRVRMGEITEAEAAERRAEANKKQAQQEEKAKRLAFEKDKKLKKKQAAMEFAITVVRVWANAASLGWPANLIVGALGTAAATATYLTQISAINSQKYEKGGKIGEKNTKDSGTTSRGTSIGFVNGPSHDAGGKTYRVKKDNTFAELEGGEWIIPKHVVERTPIQKLRDINAGKLKLFADGGMVGSQNPSKYITYNAAGTNVIIPQGPERRYTSPIVGFNDSGQDSVMLHITDLERKQSTLNKSRKLISYR